MEYSRILRRIWVKIGEMEYPLSFSLSVIEKLDTSTGGNLVQNIRKTPPITLCVDGFSYGLMNANKGMKLEEARKLCNDYVLENGMAELIPVFFACIAASGLMGPTASKQMLEAFNMKCRDKVEEPQEETEKNGEKRKG